MISIHKNENGTFNVVDGDWIADSLGWDEMLGCVARITLHDNVPKRPYMRNYSEEYFRKLNELDSKLNN